MFQKTFDDLIFLWLTVIQNEEKHCRDGIALINSNFDLTRKVGRERGCVSVYVIHNIEMYFSCNLNDFCCCKQKVVTQDKVISVQRKIDKNKLIEQIKKGKKRMECQAMIYKQQNASLHRRQCQSIFVFW